MKSERSIMTLSVDAADALIRLEAQGEHVLFLRPGYVLAALPAPGSLISKRKLQRTMQEGNHSNSSTKLAVKYHDATPAQIEHVVAACVQNLKLHQQLEDEQESKAAARTSPSSHHEALCITTTQDLRCVVPVVCGVLQRTTLRHSGLDDHMCATVLADTLNLLCSFATPSPAFSVTVAMNEGPPISAQHQQERVVRLRSVQSVVLHAATLPTISRRWQENPVLACAAYSAPLSLIETVGGPTATSFFTVIRGAASAGATAGSTPTTSSASSSSSSLASWIDLWNTIERLVPAERDGLEVLRLLLGIVISLEVGIVDDSYLRPRTVHDANGLVALLILLRRGDSDVNMSFADETAERAQVRHFLAETQTTADPFERGVRRLCVVADELASFLTGWILDCSNNTLLTMTANGTSTKSAASSRSTGQLSSLTVVCTRCAISEGETLTGDSNHVVGTVGSGKQQGQNQSAPLQGLFSRTDLSAVASKIEGRMSRQGNKKSNTAPLLLPTSSLLAKQLEVIEGAEDPRTGRRKTLPLGSGARNVVSIRHLPANVASDHVTSWAARLHHVEGSLANSDEVVMRLMKGRGRMLLDLLLLGSRVSPADLHEALGRGQMGAIVQDLRANLLLDQDGDALGMITLLPESQGYAEPSSFPVLVVKHAFGTVAYDLQDVPWLPTLTIQRADASAVSLFSCLSEDVIRTHSIGDASSIRSSSSAGQASRSTSSVALDNREERRCLTSALQGSFLKALRSKYSMVPLSVEALFSIAFKRVSSPVFLHVVPSVGFPLDPDAKERLREAVQCCIANQLLEQQLAPKYVKSVPFDHFCRVFFPILQRSKPQSLKLVSQRQAQEQLSDSDFVTMICSELGLEASSYTCSDFALMLTGKGWADLNTLKTADEAATRQEQLVRQAAEDAARLLQKSDSTKNLSSSPSNLRTRRGSGAVTTRHETAENNASRSVAFAPTEQLESDPRTPPAPLGGLHKSSSPVGSVGSAARNSSSSIRLQHTTRGTGSSPTKQRRADEPPWKRTAPPVKLTQNVAKKMNSFRAPQQTEQHADPKSISSGRRRHGEGSFVFTEFDSLLKEQLLDN